MAKFTIVGNFIFSKITKSSETEITIFGNGHAFKTNS